MRAVKLTQADLELLTTALAKWEKSVNPDGYTGQQCRTLRESLTQVYEEVRESCTHSKVA